MKGDEEKKSNFKDHNVKYRLKNTKYKQWNLVMWASPIFVEKAIEKLYIFNHSSKLCLILNVLS